MRYILDCVNERGLHIELQNECEFIRISICDIDNHKTIYLGRDELYELIGALHHIQKQIKGDTNG